MENPALEPKTSPRVTYCNFATQNLMRSLKSAGITDALVLGRANEMRGKLENSSAYLDLGNNRELAISYDAKGNFVVHLYVNLDPKRSGHVGSFSVGSNRELGEVANIGTTNGYLKISKVYKKNVELKYFMLKK